MAQPGTVAEDGDKSVALTPLLCMAQPGTVPEDEGNSVALTPLIARKDPVNNPPASFVSNPLVVNSDYRGPSHESVVLATLVVTPAGSSRL